MITHPGEDGCTDADALPREAAIAGAPSRARAPEGGQRPSLAASLPATLPAAPTPWRAAEHGGVRLDREEMYRYLGHTDQHLEPELAARIEAIAAGVESDLAPRGAWGVFPVIASTGSGEVSPSDAGAVNPRPVPPEREDAGAPHASAAAGADSAPRNMPHIRLGGTTVVLSGRDIFRHLKDARWAAVIACTLGHESERMLRLAGSRRPFEGAVLDAACSAYAEAAAEAMDRLVSDRARDAGLFTTWRFSPGYGDLPLDAQPALLAAVNAGRLCGITTTPANLLMPTKSITAIIGIFDQEPTRAGIRGCASCRLRTGCSFRARGVTCYRQEDLHAPGT